MTIPKAWDGVHQHAPTAALCLSYGIWKALHTGGMTPTAALLPGSYHGDGGGEKQQRPDNQTYSRALKTVGYSRR